MKVGVAMTVGGVLLLGGIAAAVLLGSRGSSAASQRLEPIVTETPALPEPDPEAAARAAENARIAKSDIWKRAPEPVAPVTPTDPKQLGVVPVPPLPDVAEVERDRVRHAEVAAELDRRAKEHELELQAASLAEARGKLQIDMYSADWCGTCRKALAYLQTQPGLRYTVHNIDRESGARDKMRALNPEHSIPTFDIDGTVIVGFGTRSFEHALDTAARKRVGLPVTAASR